MPALAISVSQLESHLWEAANILRGPVDAADFKTYVFPLLFFKRISDVHDEEYQAALAEAGGDEEYARFRNASVTAGNRASEMPSFFSCAVCM
jgi:type I restriction enzyme M protein